MFSKLEEYLVLVKVVFHTYCHDLCDLSTYCTKYNWHHVIHIIFQLYMILDLGIKLKSMSVKSWR